MSWGQIANEFAEAAYIALIQVGSMTMQVCGIVMSEDRLQRLGSAVVQIGF